jgi:hypothetical protein
LNQPTDNYLVTTFKSFLLLSVFISCLTDSVLGQTNQIGAFLRTGAGDAEVLTKAYLRPLVNGIESDLNTGWFTAASSHKFLGFDIQIHVAATFIPPGSRRFNVRNLDLKKTEVADGASAFSPTANGDNLPGTEVVIKDDNNKETAHFRLPGGSGLHLAPAPMIQASVGLIKKTDLIVRYVPNVHAGDYGNFQMEGVGFKHSLSQWIFSGNTFPVNIAVAAGYTHVRVNAALHLRPASNAVPDPSHPGSYNDQKVKTAFNTFTAQLVVGKSFPFISVYLAGGYAYSKMKLAVKGDYPVAVNDNGIKETTTLTDPFSYRQTGSDKFNVTAGLEIKLFFFRIFGQYSIGERSTVDAGIGVSFR